MNLWGRLKALFGMKSSKLMDKLEDPNETLDYSYEQMQGLLLNVKRGVADVVTSKKRVEQQLAKAETTASTLDLQARQAVAAGRDDLARQALTRKQVAVQQAESVRAQVANLEDQQTHLIQQQSLLEQRIEAFRSQKEVVKATYASAQARVKIGESMTGITQGAYDAGQAIARVQDKTDQMQARADAIGELVDADVLTDYSGDDHLTRELSQVSQSKAVDDDLARLKGELAPATEKAALSTGE